MRSKTISYIIIAINLLILALIAFTFYDEISRTGKIEWVNQNEIEDGDELYLLPILFLIAILGITSVIYEFIKLARIRSGVVYFKTLSLFLKILSITYGSILIITTFVLLIGVLGNSGSFDLNKEFLRSILFIVATLLVIGLLGGLIVYHNTRSKNSASELLETTTNSN